MAISATTGATVSNAVAGSSLVFGAASQTSGQTFVITVAILDTTKSVSTISDGTNSGTLRGSATNGSAVRVEIWTMPVASSATRTITVTLSGNSLASAAYTEYAGSTGLGNIGTGATGTNAYPEGDVLTQDTSSWSVCGIAVASSSGDTYTTDLGTIRQSLIPALTTASIGLIDNTSIVATTIRNGVLVSNATRAWAAVALELRTGVAATTVGPQKSGPTTNPKNAAGHQKVAVAALFTLPPANFGEFS